ncbi:type II toxin-antitoxin system RelE/ParE family toxin [Burkholderia sp. L27(2015)]|uniref:type II toxin-antitoxin system RelE/ParE family toxin n=1 Tax=Burkholderia sp. L27(2015) TaxID=1641858 RepID=UPI00131B5F76|nr:type II toxin-antitoxin system RelE/ParE family toxin [Burkholderia sp. L27(2015)]
MTVEWLKTALRQLGKLLIDLEDYAGKRSADSLQRTIDKKTKLLETQPELYVAGLVPDTHGLVVTPNVVLVYRIKPAKNKIQILRALKPRMKRPVPKKKGNDRV